MGVITNKQESIAKLLLDKMNILPKVLVGGDTCKYNKLHPYPLIHACKILNVIPSNCLFTGDDIIDIQAGRAANIKTIAVHYGYDKVKPDWLYDYSINQADELLQWLC